MPETGSHQERIRCAGCGQVVTATVMHTEPWNSYVHECMCGYINMESEWDRVPEIATVADLQETQED